MRHTFATRKLIEWYRAGLDVERELPKLTTYLGHVDVGHTYWYIEAVPELLQLATENLTGRRGGGAAMKAASFPTLLQRFFTDRLLHQLNASSHTVSSYRDSFRLLLRFAAEHIGRTPSELNVEDLDVSFLGKFLEHIELQRGNCTRTRNNRLSALRAFFRYVSLHSAAGRRR